MKKVIFLSLAMIFISIMTYAASTHTMKDGDTLWDLSAKYYGNPTLYTILLEVNGITNPRTISNGRVVIIPDKNKMIQIANETNKSKRKNLVNQANGGKNNSGNSDLTNPNTSNQAKDQVSRKRTKLNENDLSFISILQGPDVTSDSLIKVTDNK